MSITALTKMNTFRSQKINSGATRTSGATRSLLKLARTTLRGGLRAEQSNQGVWFEDHVRFVGLSQPKLTMTTTADLSIFAGFAGATTLNTTERLEADPMPREIIIRMQPPAGETIRSTQDGRMEGVAVTGQSPVAAPSTNPPKAGG